MSEDMDLLREAVREALSMEHGGPMALNSLRAFASKNHPEALTVIDAEVAANARPVSDDHDFDASDGRRPMIYRRNRIVATACTQCRLSLIACQGQQRHQPGRLLRRLQPRLTGGRHGTGCLSRMHPAASPTTPLRPLLLVPMRQPRLPRRARGSGYRAHDAADHRDHVSDRWTCRWCGWRHPVATLVAEHEARCVARPAEDETT